MTASSTPVPPRPVLPGFHPDPSICRVGDTYWMVCSSFEYAPGVPLFRSTDLVSWEQVGHVLDRPEQLQVADAPASGGITAPTLRYHDGRFWVITTNLADGAWQLLVHTTDPLGAWSDPIRLPDTRGIDPDLAWDDDGTCYLTYAGFAATGPAGIVQSVIDPMAGTVLSERHPLWQGTGGKFPEGPHLYAVGDWWYLLLAEGGTERGHAVTISRGQSPSGPFEPCPWNPLVTARGSDAPVQNTGHADLVQRPDQTWAMVFHGVRPRGSSPEWHVLGRETFVADIGWEDGWPRLGRWMTPTTNTAVRQELSGPSLPDSWVAPGRFPEDVMVRDDAGWHLRAARGGASETFVGRRQEHLYAAAQATVVRTGLDGVGGLSIRIDDRHQLGLEVQDGVVRAVARVGALRQVLGETGAPADAEIILEIRSLPCEGHFSSTETGPDTMVAGVVHDEGFTEIGRLDGRYVSTEVAGGMTGRMLGVWCSRGEILVTSFAYAGSDDPTTVPAFEETT